jgi:hypothetical protein
MGRREILLVFLLAVIAGIYFDWHGHLNQAHHFSFQKSAGPGTPNLAHKSLIPPNSAVSSQIIPVLRTKNLQIVNSSGTRSILLDQSDEGGPGLWIVGPTAMVNLGVHANGFPFFLVSDEKIRNFGLGRVDGKNASPIFVFRSDDLVKMVFGLSMTEDGQPPFLVHYSADGKMNVPLGKYCDNPSRVCTQ